MKLQASWGSHIVVDQKKKNKGDLLKSVHYGLVVPFDECYYDVLSWWKASFYIGILQTSTGMYVHILS